MADIKDVSAGTVALESPQADSMTVTGDLTVDTNTLFVDASENAIGIGTTTVTDAPVTITNSVTRAGSWDAKLALQSTGANDFPALLFTNSNTTQYGGIVGTTDTSGDDANNQTAQIQLLHTSSGGNLAFRTNGNIGTTSTTERMRIDSSGNVGIGATPEAPLHVKVGTNENFRISSDSGVRFQAMNDAASAINTMKIGGDPLIFLGTGGTERMRVDSSGDLFVAKTSQNVDTDGHELRADGVTVHTANGASPLFLNRRSSDGTVATFMRSGTTVGAIGAVSGDIFFAGPDDNHAALRLAASARTVLPVNSSGALSDNSTDLGQSSARFDDIFATNGTIQTSDQNEKQQIASLTDAEIAAAKRISNGFKTFKWNDAVTAKGDNARTHAGVIAQEVRTALEAEGLDAGKYAFFMSKWWNTMLKCQPLKLLRRRMRSWMMMVTL